MEGSQVLWPICIAIDEYPYVREALIDFEWHSGMAISQKQKSIRSLHKTVTEQLKYLKYLPKARIH